MNDASPRGGSARLARTGRLLLAQMRPIRAQLVVGLLLMTGGSLAQLVQPIATGRVMEALGDDAALQQAVVLLLGTMAVVTACHALGNFALLRSAEDVVAGIRVRSVRRILSMSLPGFATFNPGDLMTRVTSDAGMVRVIALQVVTQMVLGLITVTGSLVLMFHIEPFLLTVTLCAIFPSAMLLVGTTPRVKLWSRRTQEATGELGKQMERVFGLPVTVKASTAETTEAERIETAVTRVRRTGTQAAVWRAASQTISVMTIQVAYIVVLAVGGIMVAQGDLTVAELIPFLMYATQLSAPVISLTTAYNALQTGSAALERLAALETTPLDHGSGTPLAPGAPNGTPHREDDLTWDPAAACEDVRFTYPRGESVSLDGASLTFPRSGLVALVGPSGCGKSTVLRLLDGLYEADAGTVAVGGRDVAEWDTTALRRAVAYVEQESPVLEGTLRQNLLYGLDAPVEDGAIRRALHGSRLGAWAGNLDEDIGYRGSTMSGGERQRLSVARALLRDPRVILLDEATSALDQTTEAELMTTIRATARTRCVVMVAHRMTTVQTADRIYVMDAGRVRAQGTHEELLADDPLYRSLVSAEDERPEDDAVDGAPRAGATAVTA